MKRLFLAFALLALFSCSHDKDGEQVCTNKIWNMTVNGGIYYASYGETAETAGTIVVNEQTYDYYTGLGDVTDGSLCWEGPRG